MAQTGLPLVLSLCFTASQMNLRELAQAKSRTFLASNTQVLVSLGREDSFFLASSGVIMNIGFDAFPAVLSRSLQLFLRHCSGFFKTPVALTTWSSGTVMATR